MVNQDVFKLTVYSLCGASCAIYSLGSIYQSIIHQRKISRIQYTKHLEKSDLELPDYQIVRSHAPVGYFKLQGRITSRNTLTSGNGIECYYYERTLNYSQYETKEGIIGKQYNGNYPFYIKCYNGIVDSICYVLYMGQRMAMKWHDPFAFDKQFAENIGSVTERQSCDLTLSTYEGIQVQLDLNGCCLELNECEDEKLILNSDHITAIGYIHIKDSQLIMSKPLLKWYLITNKESNQLIKKWWRLMIWYGLRGIAFGILSYYSFYKMDLWLDEYRSLPTIMAPMLEPSFWEQMLKTIRLK